MTHQPLVIAGPSGSGKTYLAEQLSRNHHFELVLSSMTRLPREGERHLVDNEFLNDEQFDTASDNGDFIMVNNFFGNRYGYRRSFVEDTQNKGTVPMAIVFTPIVDQFFAAYPESFGVFLKPASMDLLRRRMRQRGDAEAEITKRIISAEKELATFQNSRKLFSITAEIKTDRDVFDLIEQIVSHYEI